MKPNFKDWVKIIESSGSNVEETTGGFKVIGDVILINCGLTRIPSGLVEVTGTLDISLNPVESFECDLKNVGRLICMGTKPSSLEMSGEIMINGKQVGEKAPEWLKEHVKIQDFSLDDFITEIKFRDLRKKLPELEGLI
jgi:hypothetical protein